MLTGTRPSCCWRLTVSKCGVPSRSKAMSSLDNSRKLRDDQKTKRRRDGVRRFRRPRGRDAATTASGTPHPPLGLFVAVRHPQRCCELQRSVSFRSQARIGSSGGGHCCGPRWSNCQRSTAGRHLTVMESGVGSFAWERVEGLGVGPSAEKALAESIRVKVRRLPLVFSRNNSGMPHFFKQVNTSGVTFKLLTSFFDMLQMAIAA